MCDLAFNVNGEPFEVPPGAASWRVRRLRPKGAPEVVYGREGTPLMLPVESDMDDLRREARSEGRYRLDALDEHNRHIAGSPSAYVHIHAAEPNAPEPAAAAVARNALPTGPDQSLIEAMRVNSELARTVIVNFPQMLESAAMLVRAADAAGMPARPPRPFELIQVDAQEDEEQVTPTEAPAKTGGVMGFVEMILEKLAPELVKAVLSGKLQVPGGVGALLDCRRAVPKAEATEPPPMHSPGAGPAPDRRDPAPGAGPAPDRRDPAPAASSSPPGPAPASPRSADTPARTAAPARPRSADTPARAAAPAQPRSADTPARATALAAHGTAETPARADAPARPTTEPPEELPTIDQADLAHFTAILNALTLKERLYAQALAGELSAADLRVWIAELKQLSIAEAVARIRAVLQRIDDEAGAQDATSGGVS